MKLNLVGAVFLSSLSTAVIAASNQLQDISQDDDVAAIDQLFKNYLDFQNRDDMDAIASEIYRPPVLSLYANKVYQTSADLAAAWKAYLGKPREDGRQRSISSVRTCLMSKTVAISAVDFVVPTDGSEGIAKRPWFYTLQKTAGAWRIVSLAPRDASSTFACARDGQ